MDKSGISPLCDRLKQYKMTTPPWKQTFRKDCMDRLRNNRRRLIDGKRHGLSDDLLKEEWTKLRENHDDIDYHLGIYEEIKKELEDETDRIYEEYIRSMNVPNGTDMNQGNLIGCAACGRQNDYKTALPVKEESNPVPFCDCGQLRVDRQTKVLEPSLTWLETCERLVTAAAGHATVCPRTPFVNVIDGGMNDGNQLVMFCQVCGMQLVIW